MQNLNIHSLFKDSKIHRPLLFHSVLWVLAFLILSFIFSKGHTPITADYLYTFGFLIVVAIPVCINFYILIPKFLKQKRYLLYAFLFILNFLIFSFLTSTLFGSILNILFTDYFFVSYLSEANIYLTFGIILIVSTLFKLTEDWFYFNSNEKALLQLKNQQIETQLSALRAQINPHFLFNSLNVIYAMALEKKENITTAIVELSDILRYVIYDADTEGVSLKDELKLLKNYVAFQEYRGHSEFLVDSTIHVENENFKIYPMLLLPLLENAYKYGFADKNASENIQIELKQNENQFFFKIKNSNGSHQQNLDDNYSGFGLKNLKNNLNLVYPNNHQFHIEHTKETFTVTLKIEDDQF